LSRQKLGMPQQISRFVLGPNSIIAARVCLDKAGVFSPRELNAFTALKVLDRLHHTSSQILFLRATLPDSTAALRCRLLSEIVITSRFTPPRFYASSMLAVNLAPCVYRRDAFPNIFVDFTKSEISEYAVSG
jgi:hypothetical protein